MATHNLNRFEMLAALAALVALVPGSSAISRPALAAVGGQASPAQSETKPEKKDKEEKKTSIEFEYVKENFAEHFHPTSSTFNDDGTADITFDFRKKNPDHEKLFSPTVSRKIQSDFRWTVPGEESLLYSTSTTTVGLGGLRIGNRGFALLNIWFVDNVSVEIEYEQGVNQTGRQSMALVLFNDKNKRAVGSNFGTQCVTLRGGRLSGRPAGKVETLLTNQRYKLKLEVKDGVFKAYRNGREKAKKKYNPKNFDSGRVGFSWNGGLAGIITSMTISGKVDAEKMLKIMRKKGRR